MEQNLRHHLNNANAISVDFCVFVYVCLFISLIVRLFDDCFLFTKENVTRRGKKKWKNTSCDARNVHSAYNFRVLSSRRWWRINQWHLLHVGTSLNLFVYMVLCRLIIFYLIILYVYVNLRAYFSWSHSNRIKTWNDIFWTLC